MIFKSIRWRLQAWQAIMLICVLAGFGATVYQLDRMSRWQRIDRDLQFRSSVVLAALQAGPRGRLPRGEDTEGVEGGLPESGEPDLPGPNARRPGRGKGPPPGLGVRERDEVLFTGAGSNSYYYALFHRAGDLISKSDYAPADLIKPERGESNNITRVRGRTREFITFTPPGEVVITGVDLGAEYAELRRLGWLLFAAGVGVLLVGLAGGWWMATRAIRPIQDISVAATRIAGGDLAQRIETTETESELGQLVGVLNSTFARLDATFAQQKQFTSDAAHELRTPVSVILTQTQSTLNKERSPAEYRATLEACQRAAQRMRRLTESLLELARLDAGRETIKRKPVDLAGTARECVELIRPLAAQRQIKITGEFGDAATVGDPERIAQVITNLLTNAVHHNREGGEVRLTTKREVDSVIVTVSDNGPGIAAEHLPHLFDRFYRVDAARTSAQGRTGLGLAISKSVVEAHGGTLEVASEPGRGATFTVRLPAERPA